MQDPRLRPVVDEPPPDLMNTEMLSLPVPMPLGQLTRMGGLPPSVHRAIGPDLSRLIRTDVAEPVASDASGRPSGYVPRVATKTIARRPTTVHTAAVAARAGPVEPSSGRSSSMQRRTTA
jgi:hypothetical protein